MPLDSLGYLSPTSYGERDIGFHRPTRTEQEQANSTQSVRARRAVDEDGEVLRRAADYIEKHGWCQYTLGAVSGEVCLLGALLAAAPNATTAELRRAINRLRVNPVGFNDAPGRTKAEVIARLRSAAEQRA